MAQCYNIWRFSSENRLWLAAGRWAHWRTSATEATRTAGTEIIINLRVVFLATEGGELVGEREHHVARQCVVLHIADIVGGDASADALSLTENIKHLGGDCSRLVAQELVACLRVDLHSFETVCQSYSRIEHVAPVSVRTVAGGG